MKLGFTLVLILCYRPKCNQNQSKAVLENGDFHLKMQPHVMTVIFKVLFSKEKIFIVLHTDGW